MNSYKLQRAADLAVLTSIITDRRELKPLTTRHLDYLKGQLRPWWVWMLRNEEKDFVQVESAPILLELLVEKGYAEEHQDRLNNLCEHVWLARPLTPETSEYLLLLAINLRHRLLITSP